MNMVTKIAIGVVLLCIFLIAVVGSWLAVKPEVQEPHDCFDDQDIFQ